MCPTVHGAKAFHPSARAQRRARQAVVTTLVSRRGYAEESGVADADPPAIDVAQLQAAVLTAIAAVPVQSPSSSSVAKN
jgi:hypothetical protein